MRKKVLSLILLWAALLALALIYTDRDEYTWRYEGGELAQIVITREEALLRINPAQLDQLMHPQIAKGAERNVIARGLNASPGAAVGGIVFSAADAVAEKEAGRDCVLVRWETTPDDLKGMVAADEAEAAAAEEAA